MRKFIFNGMNIGYTAPDRAQDVSYDNTSSGLSSETTQAAIDELTVTVNNKVDKEEGKGLFSGSYNDLTDKPSIPAAVAVKGNNEVDYRTGNVNITAKNVNALYNVDGVVINSLDELVNLMYNSGNSRSFSGVVKINTNIGLGFTGWARLLILAQNSPDNRQYALGMFCLYFPTAKSDGIRWAIIDGHTAGNYSVTSTGYIPYTDQIPTNLNQLTNGPGYITGITKAMVTNALGYTPPTTNTTYSAGSNITLSGTTFSLTKANVTGALGYTPPTTNTTYSAGSNITLSGTTFSLTKANVTGALGYTPPTSDTNNACTQTNTAASNANYRVLYSASGDDTTRTEGARKGRLFYNPNNHVLFNDSSYWAFGPNYFNQNNVTVLSNDANQSLYIAASTEANYRAFLGVRESAWTFCPHKDKELRLGNPSYRWGQIYSGSGTINTSDRKEKKDIESLDEKAKDLIMKLNPVSYKFINGESGRTHYGMVAQDVEEELTELGISPMDFAGFCKDQKYETQEEEYYIEDEKRIRYNAVPVEGEYTYGLRYEEFIAPLIKTVQIQQKQIDKLEKEIELLKKER